jgi:predicted 2-oxoglutarate/Fe(II)-dependent dioxygenase YbiX
MVLMLFFGTAGRTSTAEAFKVIARNRSVFDDRRAAFFGVTVDPRDAAEGRIAQRLPGIRFFLDYQRELSRLYCASGEGGEYDPHWLVLDQELRILRRFPIGSGEEAIAFLTSRISQAAERHAPVVTVPEVLEPELCRRLIEFYEESGGTPSGFMRDVDGQTTLIHDPEFKRRRDCRVEDEELRGVLAARIQRRLVPAIERAFQFRATRIERWLVACYEAGNGHFRPHRDNTTFGTAHRRFAVTINLNASEYEGGDLRFPEFGGSTYRAPTGGAIVFSCSLLHEATQVTAGKRYAFLPFLYDDAAAEVRRANLSRLADAAPPPQNAGS